MATPIGALQVDLLLQSQEFVRSVNRASEQVNTLGRAVNQQTTLMTRGFDTAAASLKSFAAGFIGVTAVQQLARATTATFAWADALKEASDRIGIGVEQMQRLQRAAALTNVSNEQVTKNLETFARGLGNAAKGTGTLHTALKSMHISLREQDGSLRSVNEVFDEYADAISNAGTKQEAITRSVSAFGRGGAEFVTTIKQMQESVDEFNVLTDEQVTNLAEYDDVINNFTEQLGYYAKVGIGEYISLLEKYYGAIRNVVGTLVGAFDKLSGTAFAADVFGFKAATTSVTELNSKLEESTNLLQRYRAVAEQVQEGAGIAAPGTNARILALEKDRIALLNQLKRAAEAATPAVSGLGDAADDAADQFAKLDASIKLIDASAINVEEMGRRMGQISAGGLSRPDFTDAAKEQQRLDKQAEADAKRLAEARIKGIAALKMETSDLERLTAAYNESASEVRLVELALEAENTMRRLSIELGTEDADVITAEIEKRRELTETLEMQTAAAERQMAVFRAMNEEEMGRRMGQAEAGGMSAPDVPAGMEKELSDPFENALKSVQSEFTSTFEQMQLGGIRTFEDIADAAQGIFANLNANILSLAIFDPDALNQIAGRAGLTGGQLTGAAAATAFAPAALGMLGAGQASQGASMGGAIGAGVGAIGGSFFGPGGTVLGGTIGGLVGTAAGGLFGGLFGGGGGGSQVSFGGSALGKAGAGGTGDAAKFVQQIDTQIIAAMTFRQEKLINAMLSEAKSTSVQYGEEGPSANDLAALAAARIRPAAAALGFSGAVAKGAPEQQMANLQQAVAIMQQVQAIDLGPLGSELENLKAAFNETAMAAKKFGVDNRDELEKQYRFERAAIQRRFASEKVGLEEMFGQRTSTSAALAQLDLQFAEAAARAEQLGISTAGMASALAKAKEAVREQAEAQRIGLIEQARALAGLPQTFASTVATLRAQFATLRKEMEALGESVAAINQLEKEAMKNAQEQRHQTALGIQAEAKGLVGLPPTFKQEQEQLAARFEELRKQMAALGYETAGLIKLEKQAAAALQERRHQTALSIQAEAKGLVGLPPTFKQEQEQLAARFEELRKQMAALGYETAGLIKLEKQAAAALQERRHQTALSIQAEAKGLVGGPQTFLEDKAALDARFMELRKQFAALGYSTAGLILIHKRAVAALYEQRKAAMDALNMEGRSLTGLAPTFKEELDELNKRFADLRKQMAALGGDTSRLTQQQKDAQAVLKKEQQMRRDEMALSIVEPFKQLREPLVAFSRDLQLGNMNPAAQMTASRDEFRRISQLAMSGDLEAIRQLQSVGQDFISMAQQFGGSTGGVEARTEVMRVVNDVIKSLDAAQKLAMQGVEGAVKAAELAIVDTLGELVKVGRETVAEIKRLSGAVTPAKIPVSKPPPIVPIPLPRPTSTLQQPIPLPKPTGPMPLPISLPKPTTPPIQITAESMGNFATRVSGPLQMAAQKALGSAGNGPITAEAMSSLINNLDQSQTEERRELLDAIKRAAQRELDKMSELAAEVRIVADEIKRQGRK